LMRKEFALLLVISKGLAGKNDPLTLFLVTQNLCGTRKSFLYFQKAHKLPNTICFGRNLK